ncbi:MAG: LysM peptidoglycan-binding domain-containing protein [Chthoniobacterales bacterium]|nr:LysM peptidoglycan-binding domain-containing protein [Chthoniobacterales bacterium]
MKPLLSRLFLLAFTATLCLSASAQTSLGGEKSPQLETLIKKIDAQNMKIDALSQQILKLEQRISALRPGVMVGETTPAPAAPAGPTTAAPAAPANGNAHVVAKGETLISIAKLHKVDVDALQKHNQIEDARKLQAGQTIMIPTAGTSPTASPTPSPNE